MYTKILVPLDGSQGSESVLPLATKMASAFAIPMELFHVVETDMETLQSAIREKQTDRAAKSDLTTKGSAYLQRIAGTIPKPLPVSFDVEIGNAPDRIVDKAAKDPGTLIAMASRGASGIRRWIVGSVADKVLQVSLNPLLILRGQDERNPEQAANVKQVMVPLDGSALAETALPHAVSIAKRLNLKVELLRSYAMPIGVAIPSPFIANAELITADALREQAETYLNDKASQVRSEGITEVSHVVAAGEAAQQIIDAAETAPNTLIVMCTHGRTGMGRWVLGSVTTRVVHHGGDRILVVRPPSDQR